MISRRQNVYKIYTHLKEGIFEKHIGQIIIIFGILRDAGLKVNAPKCSFWLKDITYLIYAITREVIKPNPKKVQGIMYVGRPSPTTKPRVIIVMVQYYRDMWPMRSHILAPLTEADSGPKVRKILQNGAI